MADNKLQYDNTARTSSKGKAILGRLTGPCADIIHSTRNGRKYSQKLWEKVFSDPIVKEYFECGGIFGELNHPADREETDLTKVCICMPEPPKKDANNNLIGSWDILDTPNGRILKCLCDYGYKVGISSRGSGDTYIDSNGEETVDPDSYNFQGFDIVYLPAVKTARLQYEGLNESLSTSKSNFRAALKEAYDRSSDDDRKVMAETLEDLNLSDFLSMMDDMDDVKKSSVQLNEAANNGSDATIKELQNIIRENTGLKKEITSLKEQLSVCYAKEAEQEQNIEKLKNSVSKLSESVQSEKALREKTKYLSEQLLSKESGVSKFKEAYSKKLDDADNLNKSLNEQLSIKTNLVNSLSQEKRSLEESLNSCRKKLLTLEKDFELSQKNLADAKKDTLIKEDLYSKKADKNRQIVEQYKSITKRAIERYIELRANVLGVSSSEISNRLSENYSFDDIDRVCESIQQYSLNISELPFVTLSSASTNKKSARVELNESNNNKPVEVSKYDDLVDSSLMSLAGL